MFTKIKSLLMILLVGVSTGLFAEATVVADEQLKASAEASTNWLAIIDQEKYEMAWEKGALTLKLRVPLNSWLQIMEASRKPLGKMVNRKVIDQRIAKNPPGLPAGDYIVMIYNTDFDKVKAAAELVTLVLESDGKWRGLTYQVHD
jgi:hypothetical protein